MEPKYISFIKCSLQKGKWIDLQPAYYKDAGTGFIYSNYLSVHNSRDEGAKVALTNMFHEEEIIRFKFDAIIAIVPGLLRLDSEQVINTDVGSPEMLAESHEEPR